MKIAFLLVVSLLLAGCSGGVPNYEPGVDASDFVEDITNPFLPWKPGSHWTYDAQTGDGAERINITVLAETRIIMGVTATIVRDTVTVSGELREDTFDWYAQDRTGNVWYLGEEVKNYENGHFVDQEGSWEWGVDGALPGIAMKADPVADGQPYYQEFYGGEAEDQAAVIGRGTSVTVPLGTYNDTVVTREWTRLEKGIEEQATYARGVGLVAKETTKGGPSEREALVEFTPA